MFREDAFRVKLNAPNGVLFMFDAHDFAFIRFGGDFEAIGQGFPPYDQGMIASGGEWIGDAFEKVLAIVLNRRGFAVHHAVVHHDITTEYVADALMAQANSQRWNVGAKGADNLVG